MNKDAYDAAEVGYGGLRRWRRFSLAVFDKDSWSCMVVRFAVQAMSSTMGSIITFCKEYNALGKKQLDIYGSMERLIVVVNNGVDAFNGRRDDTHDFGPITQGNFLKRLAPIWDLLQFFAEWELNLSDDSLDLSPAEKKKFFLPRECWMDIKQSCLG
jgi:hypothetical protein